MKAKQLIKESISIEDIYKDIQNQNDNKCFKHFIPHHVFISDKIKLELIENGFKVYIGDWDGIMKDCVIVEW
jgi:hypothetical protein